MVAHDWGFLRTTHLPADLLQKIKHRPVKFYWAFHIDHVGNVGENQAFCARNFVDHLLRLSEHGGHIPVSPDNKRWNFDFTQAIYCRAFELSWTEQSVGMGKRSVVHLREFFTRCRVNGRPNAAQTVHPQVNFQIIQPYHVAAGVNLLDFVSIVAFGFRKFGRIEWGTTDPRRHWNQYRYDFWVRQGEVDGNPTAAR